MIRKLRFRLVLAAMLSLTLVLSIIIGMASYMNYARILRTADSTLQILRENDGKFPEAPGSEAEPELEGETPPGKPSQGEAGGTTIGGSAPESTAPEEAEKEIPLEKPESSVRNESAPGEMTTGDRETPPEKPNGEAEPEVKGNADSDRLWKPAESPEVPSGEAERFGGKLEDRLAKELPFESRYFSVFFKADGTVTEINVGRIAAVDEEEAESMARSLLESREPRGFLADYRYLVYEEAGEIRILFLDCGRTLDSFRSFIRNSVVVTIIGLMAVLGILILVSHRIVKPFAESYQKQRQFITDAGHELKTPLTIISADAEILEMDFGENEWLSDIQEQTKRLTELTKHLILLSRMEEEQLKTERVEFSLSQATEETAESFQAIARTQGKQLSASIAPGISMLGDQGAITRLISILLDNAMKYSSPGGEIRVTLEKQKNSASLTVENPCEHISRESTAHLFDRFYRTDSSRNSKTGGFGLGLSIAYATVRAHKGKITAATEDERSLRISVTLPV